MTQKEVEIGVGGGGSGGGGAIPTADQITVESLWSPVFNTVQATQDVNNSSGIVKGGNIVDLLDGTLKVTVGCGQMRGTDDPLATLFALDWEETIPIALTNNANSFIYLEYNGGTPQFVATTTRRDDKHTNILFGVVYKNGTTILHINPFVAYRVWDHAGLTIARMQGLEPFAHESGAMLSESGNRNLDVTAGVFWEWLNRFTTTAGNTLLVDKFIAYYEDWASSWTKIIEQDTISNLLYDDGSGTLATLGNARYGVHWVYKETDGDVVVMFWRGSYSLSDAQDAGEPTNRPPQLDDHGILIGKIIVWKNDANFTQVLSPFVTSIGTASVADHSQLTALQWGWPGEYFHLDLDQYNELSAPKVDSDFELYEEGGVADINTISADFTDSSGDTSDRPGNMHEGLDLSRAWIRYDAVTDEMIFSEKPVIWLVVNITLKSSFTNHNTAFHDQLIKIGDRDYLVVFMDTSEVTYWARITNGVLVWVVESQAWDTGTYSGTIQAYASEGFANVANNAVYIPIGAQHLVNDSFRGLKMMKIDYSTDTMTMIDWSIATDDEHVPQYWVQVHKDGNTLYSVYAGWSTAFVFYDTFDMGTELFTKARTLIKSTGGTSTDKEINSAYSDWKFYILNYDNPYLVMFSYDIATDTLINWSIKKAQYRFPIYANNEASFRVYPEWARSAGFVIDGKYVLMPVQINVWGVNGSESVRGAFLAKYNIETGNLSRFYSPITSGYEAYMDGQGYSPYQGQRTFWAYLLPSWKVGVVLMMSLGSQERVRIGYAVRTGDQFAKQPSKFDYEFLQNGNLASPTKNVHSHISTTNRASVIHKAFSANNNSNISTGNFTTTHISRFLNQYGCMNQYFIDQSQSDYSSIVDRYYFEGSRGLAHFYDMSSVGTGLTTHVSYLIDDATDPDHVAHYADFRTSGQGQYIRVEATNANHKSFTGVHDADTGDHKVLSLIYGTAEVEQAYFKASGLIKIKVFSQDAEPTDTDLAVGELATWEDTLNSLTYQIINSGGTIKKVQYT